MKYVKPSPVENMPGFYHLKDFEDYVVSKDAVFVNLKTGTTPKQTLNQYGYVAISLRNSEGKFVRKTVHRLLAKMFIPCDVVNGRQVVNHINGIKWDNRLCNLEWTNDSGNIKHGYELNGRKKQPILVRNAKTGRVVEYPNAITYARKHKLALDHVLIKCRSDGQRLYPDWLQFKFKRSEAEWRVPTKNELVAQPLFGNSKGIYIRFLESKETLYFEKLQELAEFLSVVPSVISVLMRSIGDHPTYHHAKLDFIQLKRSDDPRPWRNVEYPYVDIQQFSKYRPVVAIEETTGSIRLYVNPAACARDFNISRTTLNWRMKTNFEKTYPDGFMFGYYNAYLQKHNSPL